MLSVAKKASIYFRIRTLSFVTAVERITLTRVYSKYTPDPLSDRLQFAIIVEYYCHTEILEYKFLNTKYTLTA
jgi:hypothetical protein